jgi:hypothetical protein
MIDIRPKNAEDDRLGFTFHRTFSLVRAAISQIIAVAEKAEKEGYRKLDNKKIGESTSLGTIYIEAMPRYGRGSGLLDENNFLTTLGKYAFQNDPFLDQSGTQWLMHYYLSAPQGPGPAFWYQVVSKFFYPGNIFTNEDIVEFIGNFIWQSENRVLSKRAVQSAATILLGTYTKPEGLGKLRILEPTTIGRYRVQVPVAPPVWAVSYALLDFWMNFYEGRLGIGLDTIKESGFTQLFLMGKSDLENVLQSLQEIRYVEIHRTAPPFQVVLLCRELDPILDRLYGSR